MRTPFILLIAACLSCRAWGQPPAPPFTATWTEGRCIDCKTATDLTDVQWLNSNEAWGIGMSVPPVGLDFSIVHTVDSGRTWKELPNSWQHAAPPALTFLDSAHGWYCCWNLYCGGTVGPRMFSTRDGGRHWRLISAEGAVAMAFADENHGIGRAFGVDNTGTAVRTLDGGRTWSPIQIPRLKKIDGILLLSGQIAWITDYEGSDLLLFRTIDAGRSWQVSSISLRSESVRQLSFVDKDHGWIVLKHRTSGETRLLATGDGGQRWKPISLSPVRDVDVVPEPDVLGFVSDIVGFVFSAGANESDNRVLFTADGGMHWQSYSFPYSIGHCQAMEGDLLCSADAKGSHFGVVALHPK